MLGALIIGLIVGLYWTDKKAEFLLLSRNMIYWILIVLGSLYALVRKFTNKDEFTWDELPSARLLIPRYYGRFFLDVL